MLRRISLYSGGTAFLGKQAEEQGYKGKADAYFNAVTITIAKPDSSLEDIKRSLEITLQDIELRIETKEVAPTSNLPE